MIQLDQTSLSDILDNMSEQEIKEFITFELEVEDSFEEDELMDYIEDMGDATISYGPEIVNDYKCCWVNRLDGYVILDSNDKLICLLSEYEVGNPVIFEGIIIVPGRDSITMFSTITKTKKREYIR